jgi:hypothetical protein
VAAAAVRINAFSLPRAPAKDSHRHSDAAALKSICAFSGKSPRRKGAFRHHERKKKPLSANGCQTDAKPAEPSRLTDAYDPVLRFMCFFSRTFATAAHTVYGSPLIAPTLQDARFLLPSPGLPCIRSTVFHNEFSCLSAFFRCSAAPVYEGSHMSSRTCDEFSPC